MKTIKKISSKCSEAGVFSTLTPRTVPAPISAQLGLGEQGVPAQYRAYSAPTTTDNMDMLPPNSPDSSDAAGDAADSLSNIRSVSPTNLLLTFV